LYAADTEVTAEIGEKCNVVQLRAAGDDDDDVAGLLADTQFAVFDLEAA
jgi:hypothetical protein